MMEKLDINVDFLKELGWTDESRLPIANAENRKLEEEVEEKRKQRAILKAEIQNIQGRISDIEKHIAGLKQAQVQNQKLLTAHSAQYEAENQLYKLAQSEEAKYSQEVKQYNKEVKELTEKIQGLEQNIKKLTKKVEAKRENVKIDKDRLFSWEEKLNKKEEANLIIEQMVKSDEKTFKKTELERQKLQQNVEELRQSVMKATGDINELEMALDKTARFYNQTIKDRRILMEQWTQSVEVLRQRDKSIYNILQEINELRETGKERVEAYQEAERFLTIQISENRQIDYNTRVMEKQFARLKEERQKLSDTIEAYSVELHLKKRGVQELSRKIEDTRASVKRKESENERKRALLEEYKVQISELTETLNKIENHKLDVEEQTRQLQAMLEKEEKRQNTLTRETEQLQSLVHRTTHQLSELEKEKQLIINQKEIELKRQKELAALKITQEKSLKEKKDSVDQLDLEIKKYEAKLRSLTGQSMDKAEVQRKTQLIENLKVSLKDKLDTAKVLQSQIDQVELGIKKTTALINNDSEEIKRLNDKKQDLQLMIEGGEKQLKAQQASNDEKQVELNILQLKVSEAEKIALKADGNVYDLEKYSVQLETAMAERQAEIKPQKERLILEKRILTGEISELKSTLVERQTRINQLQIRHDNIIASLGENPEDGGPVDVVYLKIQSAQERLLLQEKGDKLDKAIKKAEVEIRCLENTLKLVNVCNDKYKKSLSIVDEDDPEKLEQKQLDQEMAKAQEELKEQKKVLKERQTDLERMKDNYEQLEKDVEAMSEDYFNKEQIVKSLEQQITDQKEKIQRADRCLKKAVKAIHDLCECNGDKSILLQEKDIVVRELREQNTLALQRIAEFTIRHVEAESYVKKLLAEKNISLPTSTFNKTTPSLSRCGSIVSSLDSRVKFSSSRTNIVSSSRTVGSDGSGRSTGKSSTNKSELKAGKVKWACKKK